MLVPLSLSSVNFEGCVVTLPILLFLRREERSDVGPRHRAPNLRGRSYSTYIEVDL